MYIYLFQQAPAGKMAIDIISFAYAATIAAGGVLGYVKAGKYIRLFYHVCIKSQTNEFGELTTPIL